MPHVMACFDVSFHSERRGRLPALTTGDSEEGDTSLEDAATLCKGGKLKSAASNSNLTDAEISFAGRKDQAFAQIMADMAFRKGEVRSSWRLARFCAMARSSDCDARYWALLQLDEMLVNLGMCTHPVDSCSGGSPVCSQSFAVRRARPPAVTVSWLEGIEKDSGFGRHVVFLISL